MIAGCCIDLSMFFGTYRSPTRWLPRRRRRSDWPRRPRRRSSSVRARCRPQLWRRATAAPAASGIGWSPFRESCSCHSPGWCLIGRLWLVRPVNRYRAACGSHYRYTPCQYVLGVGADEIDWAASRSIAVEEPGISTPCSRRRPVRQRRPRTRHRDCTTTAPPQRSPPAHRVG